MKVLFLHPRMVLGGAELLILNFALALQQQNIEVKLLTTYLNSEQSFDSQTQIPTEVRGNLIPQTIFGRFQALLANLKMIYLSLYVLIYCSDYDAIIVDQVTFGLPLLKLRKNKVIFYCHFPDKLQVNYQPTGLKKLYRIILDFIEEISLFFSDLILVNSKFTQKTFYNTFKYLQKVKTQVVYPSIEAHKFDCKVGPPLYKNYFFSLNRFEKKKNLALAIHSFALMKEGDTKLVIAGGFDSKNIDNVSYYYELQSLVISYKLQDSVIFLQNISDEQRISLLKHSIAVLYTPDHEHFGIVPCEAQYLEKPVIACNSGGPTETVLHCETGFLLTPNSIIWSKRMLDLQQDSQMNQKMGKKAKELVQSRFSFEEFKKNVLICVNFVVKGPKSD